MVEVRELSFSWKTPVLHRASASFKKGELWQIQGANGSGKTTFLRLLTGVLSPAAGSIAWGERPRIGWLGSTGTSFYNRLTVQQNLDYFGAFLESGPLIDPFGITFWDVPVEELSFGMAQKVKWVRALMGAPSVLLLDEPFHGLDADSNQQARDALREFCDKGGLAIVTHHGARISNRSLVLEGGAFHAVDG